MPDSIPDFHTHVATLERRLRGLARNIAGIGEIAKEALANEDKVDFFHTRLANAQKNWEEYENTWSERDSVQAVMDVDTFPNAAWLEAYQKTRDELCEAAGIHTAIERRSATRPSVEGQAPPRFSTSMYNTSSTDSHLPKISIPSFSGDLVEWSRFRDTFVSMVHNEASISNIRKFHYLRGALQGEALSLLNRIPVEEGSYNQAWEKLKKTYDNPRVLASLFINRILDCSTKNVKGEQEKYEIFLDNVADSVQGFRNLKLDNPGDFVLSALALRALDPGTRRQFELAHSARDQIPSTDEIIEFVRKRIEALKLSRDTFCSSGPTSESYRKSYGRRYPSRESPKYNTTSFYSASSSSSSSFWNNPRTQTTTSNAERSQGFKGRKNKNNAGATRKPDVRQAEKLALQCPICKNLHQIYSCPDFFDWEVAKRIAFIKDRNGCANCLQPGHQASTCPSKWSCRYCRERHHSMLHKGNKQVQDRQNEDGNTPQLTSLGSTSRARCSDSAGAALLGTVQLFVKGVSGQLYVARGVLDSGSQHTFMTQQLARKLELPIQEYKGEIAGLGGTSVAKPKGLIDCSLRPFDRNEDIPTKVLVVERISADLPSVALEDSLRRKLSIFPLADTSFYIPGPVDLLLGVDVYPRIVTGSPQDSGEAGIFLVPTIFGYTVMGKTKENSMSSHLLTQSLISVQDQLKAFWEIEEPQPANRQDPDDQYCEDHFVRTHSRTPEGRYVVRLPFKPNHLPLGDNRLVAIRRFYNLEAKFSKNPDFHHKYTEFMREYRELNHMRPCISPASYIIPHHGILQGYPKAQKLRVVFDASCSSSSGASLNDLLLPGPKLQADLCNVLIRFRLYTIPLCADLVKMYRQILIHPDDRKFLHIFWRDSQSEELVEMELLTDTYGVKPGAFEAIRVVKQLKHDEGRLFPRACKSISREMYVDDIVSGADTLEEAEKLQEELIQLFAKGGFTLGKWASTIPSLARNSEMNPQLFSLKQDRDLGEGSLKILGLAWDPKCDSFKYHVTQPPVAAVTKRLVLSAIARIFDPLGFLTPVVFLAKVLLQCIWKARLDWDDPLPEELTNQWRSITHEWEELPSVSISRHITTPFATLSLVGFCDASSKGYAAAVYLRSVDTSGSVLVSLVKAKSKVAPLKYTSIPRLELCGALLLSRLLASLDPTDQVITEIWCFTDSSVVLAWLNKPIYELKVFEANRISEITSITSSARWCHVASKENPCDLASRGCTPREIKEAVSWWHGPSWLKNPQDEWLETTDTPVPALALSAQNSTEGTHHREKDPAEVWISTFSSLETLIRTIARMRKYLSFIRGTSKSLSGPITTNEFQEAKQRIITLVQHDSFPELFSGTTAKVKSYQQLDPFIDDRGIVRVGGRLQNAPLDFASKHPILLPPTSSLSKLIIDAVHQKNFHSGPNLTLALLRNEFWIPQSLKRIRGRILQCVKCRIRKAKPAPPFMASLPHDRFRMFKAFLQVGVDYAGPFTIKESNRRRATLAKAYLCIFVCLSSKAVHLEAVSSLSTVAFLASFDRFIARRGLPKTIWSDNGTNFVGASRFIKDVYAFFAKSEPHIQSKLAPLGVDWKFIPPKAPHFGGIWEAGVKSVKSLLSGSIGKTPYTFEELTTVFAKIEGLLNSRPLCALNEDPTNFDFLTPGHLLTGAPLSLIPEPDDLQRSSNARPRWAAMQSQLAAVWDRWRKEYLHCLQQRKKWFTRTRNLQDGDLVILLEKRSILGHWPVGRVSACYPGRDGIVRTVDVRLPNGGTFTRAVTSLAPLFYEGD